MVARAVGHGVGLRIRGGGGTVAHTGEALAESVGVPDEAVLGFWWRAFRAKIEAWDDPDNPWSGIPTAPVGALRLLAAESGRLRVEEFAGRVWDLLRHSHDVVFTPCWELAGGRDQPAIMIVELLTRFGVVASTGGKVGLSPLGGWALDQVASLTPSVVTEMMTAAEVLAAVERLDEELAWRRAGPWLGARAPITAARELLTVAVTASPMHRMVALSLVAGLDDGALPAWREAAELPRVGPAARAFLAREFGEPEPTAQDARWQVVDESVALLAEEEVAGALSDIWDNLPGNDADAKIISIEGTGHPDAGRLIEELRRYAPLAAGRPAPPVYQLKISLMHVRPSVWRRVKVVWRLVVLVCPPLHLMGCSGVRWFIARTLARVTNAVVTTGCWVGRHRLSAGFAAAAPPGARSAARILLGRGGGADLPVGR